MTYPPPGGTPDPYQPQQPYGQNYDPYAAPSSGVPTSGQPGYPAIGQSYGKQPAYGQPTYGQPGYGYAPVAPTNTMAILALVFAFIFPPVAIVLGHMAKKQIAQTGEQGEGLATAGLWVGYIFTGLYVAFCALWLIMVVGIFGAAGIASSTSY